MNCNYVLIKYKAFIVEITGFIAVSLIFACGVGRYRIVLVFAAYSLIKAIASLYEADRKIELILLPAIIMALYYDLSNGAIIPLFTANYLIIALIAMIIMDVVARSIVNKILNKLAAGEMFMVCPSCKCDCIELVQICPNCNYSASNKTTNAVIKFSPHFKGNKLPNDIASLFATSENGEFLYYKKLSSNLAIYKSGERVLRNHFAVTTNNIILFDTNDFIFSRNKSWRERDIIPVSDISTIECQKKKLFMADRPFFMFVTSAGEIYEIAFSSFGDYKKEIDDIAKAIKMVNSQIEIKVNWS